MAAGRPGSGRYDSWYLRAVHPVQPVGLWIRHTHHVDGAGRVRGARWITRFTPTGVRAQKASFDGAPSVDSTRFVGDAGDARWDLQVESLDAPFEHLPFAWMYRASFPRTKPISVNPIASVRGEVVLGGEVLAVDGWPGMVGHNWGAEHAHRWIWLHAAGFDGEPDSWLDVTLARVRAGPLLTPWIANGALRLDGRRHRLGGLLSRPRVQEQVDHADITLAGDGLSVVISVRAPSTRSIVLWRYADPAGGEHVAANCSIAGATVRIAKGGRVRELASSHRAAYELGMREAPPGYQVQPFPDP